MNRERKLVSLRVGGREFQRRKVEGRYIRIIERRFSDKWRDTVACMTGSERIGKRQRRMGDL